MAKILLAEDDNNLREIYEARLQAEGYTVISSGDGEEALVLAKDQLPDLVISDVMMPKISGFEMLDIIRNTEGLKNAKVIMLTALGQSEDQERANKLGADRYLVKSQVTLEDIVKVAKELLEPETQANAQPTNVAQAGNNQDQPADDTSLATNDSSVPNEPVSTPIPVASEPSNITQNQTDSGSNNTAGPSPDNDKLIDNVLDDLNQDQPADDTSLATNDSSVPNEPVSTPIPVASEPSNITQNQTDSGVNSDLNQALSSEAQTESNEMSQINNQIDNFSNELANQDLDSTNTETTTDSEPQASEANPPIELPVSDATEPASPELNSSSADNNLAQNDTSFNQNPTQIAVQPSEEVNVDSSVPVSPPENVIPYSTNSYKPEIVNPSAQNTTNSNQEEKIDPSNITL